ncbi:MAG TPA: AI-2E family transporter [Microbacteriaceae bacterium]|nr:AI-2E family transporter [Microbacteriaceae bacterium]HQX35235.1 AI-2E family transporter [Microbacteriaceae bacterium]HQZ47739.1 AI-2E family transporter [Microbacteriaceae bacterium]HRA09703.1 AI-2E family transporter [Microbacteriaceae bacterium]
MTNQAPTTPAPALSPALRILLGLATTVIVLVGVFLARDIVGPLVLGAVLVIIVMPVRVVLERWGWPRWLATTGVITVAYLVLAALVYMLYYAGTQFVNLVINYAGELEQTAQKLVDWLHSTGLDKQAADAAVSILDPSTLLGFATSLGGTALSVLTAFFFVLAYVIFMAADASRYKDAGRVFGAARTATLERVRRFNVGVRRYYVVNASFGLVVAVVDTLALWALDIPIPIVWGILAFVTNFVPNIGFVLGLVPPAMLALVIGGLPLMLAVIAIYSVVNVVLQVLVQPKFVSDAVNLTLTLSFFSVIFWTFVIGPLGAILSIPLTLLVRSLILEGDPKNGWLRWLSGDGDPEPEPALAPVAELEPTPTPTPTPAIEPATDSAATKPSAGA